MVDGALQDLADSDCIEFSADSERVKSTALGRIASYYYLDHSTVGMVSTVLEGEGGDELQVPELCRYKSILQLCAYCIVLLKCVLLCATVSCCCSVTALCNCAAL
jgi:hypothetical protein